MTHNMTMEYATTTTSVHPSDDQRLQIIAQPCYSSRLRYRSDYERNQTRQGTLRSENNPNYQCPAIHIPLGYSMDIDKKYYVRACLVTALCEESNCYYIHPYELEDTRNPEYNDRTNRCVWFPVEGQGVDFIKTFPNLRVVKLKADELRNSGDLRIFDSPVAQAVAQPVCPKDTIKKYNLEKAHLAFTMGQKVIHNGVPQYIPFINTTIFSDLLIEKPGRSVDSDSTSSRPQRSIWSVHKYAPRSGYADANTEVLMFFKNKLKTSSCGELEAKFEYHAADIHWSVPVLNLKVEGQMVSFETPTFPYQLISNITVHIILNQRKRDFEPITFDYLPPPICQQCQQNIDLSLQTNANKRPLAELYPSTTDPSSTLFDDEDLNLLSSADTMTTSKKHFFDKSPDEDN